MMKPLVFAINRNLPQATACVTHSSGKRYVTVGIGVVAVLMLVPLLSVAVPPLTDLPNHISRLHILGTLDSDPVLQRNYASSWGMIPNIAIDIVALPLARIGAPYAAGKLVAVLAFVTALIGLFALHYAVHKTVSAWTGILFFVAYNQSFMVGLLNFYLGAGLAFLLLAAWITYDSVRPDLKFWLFPIATLAIYFCHLLALGLFGLLLVGYEISCLWRRREEQGAIILRRAAATGFQFVIPLALLLFNGDKTTELEGATLYEPLPTKILHLFAPFRVYVEPLDFLTILFLVTVFSVAGWKQKLRMAPGFGLPLLSIALLTLATPAVVLSIYGLDQRFAVVTGMLFVAVTRIELPLRSTAAIFLGIGFALLAWRSIDLTVHWRAINARFAELRDGFNAVDRGASVLSVQRQTGNHLPIEPLGSQSAYWHAASFAVIERSAFNPQTFTARHQPVKASPTRAALDCSACRPLTVQALQLYADPEISWETLDLPLGARVPSRHAALWPDRFDYILVVDFDDHRNPMPERLKPVHTGSFFVVYENRTRPRD